MLQIFRDKSQSTFIQTVVMVIALVFVFWGVGANMMNQRKAAIVVNDEEISYQDYQRTYDRLLSSYRQQFGGSIPEELLQSLGLSEQAQNQLIQQVLLRQGSVAMGLLVSAPEIQKNIQETPQFQDNGAFSMEKYKALLASNHFTPHKYENSKRTDMLSTKGVRAIRNFATTITDAEINDLYQLSKEKVTLQFAKIVPSNFIDKVKVKEDTLATWFEQNKNNYKTNPKVRLKFLSFPYKDQTTKDGTTDETIRAAVFQKANDAYEGIISAGSLQEYAKLHPEAVILETDFFSKQAPPETLDKAPAVQNTAFTLKKGELSSLIESPDGYSILYAEAIQEPTIPSLDAVRDRVTEDYKATEAKILARKTSDELLAALKTGTSFSELSKTHDFKLKEISLSRSSTEAEANGFPASLIREVFTLNSSHPVPDKPAAIKDTLYLYQFSKRDLPDSANITKDEEKQYRSRILSAKQERLLVAWLRHQEGTSEIFSNKNL